MNALDSTTENLALTSWIWIPQDQPSSSPVALQNGSRKPSIDWLRPLRQWLDQIKVQDAELARSLCKLIPSQCPFERDINLFGRTLLHIPPLCKLNPLYEEVVSLRFRALCYLADECGEDVTPYC